MPRQINQNRREFHDFQFVLQRARLENRADDSIPKFPSLVSKHDHYWRLMVLEVYYNKLSVFSEFLFVYYIIIFMFALFFFFFFFFSMFSRFEDSRGKEGQQQVIRAVLQEKDSLRILLARDEWFCPDMPVQVGDILHYIGDFGPGW